MSLNDFMNYLIYVERSAENLQFYLWHQDYVKRFKDAKTSDLTLSPEWTKSMEDDVQAKLQRDVTEKLRPDAPDTTGIFSGTDFEQSRPDVVISPAADDNPFSTPPPTAISNDDARESVYAPSSLPSNASTVQSQASSAFAAAGAKTPCESSSPSPLPQTRAIP